MTLQDGVLKLSGSADESSIVLLRNRVRELVGAGEDLALELSDVDYFPSAAIGVVAKAGVQAREAGQHLDLVARPGSVAQRVLAISGLSYLPSLVELDLARETREAGTDGPGDAPQPA